MGTQEAREQLAQIAVIIFQQSAVSVQSKQTYLQKAVDEMEADEPTVMSQSSTSGPTATSATPPKATCSWH